jgi:hypothetical protein
MDLNPRIWRTAVLILISALFLFLANRANDKYRWSDWSFGDVQTMLSLKQWHEDGWIHNYLLFKPQGYSPVVDLLDEPGLRQHAHGISPGSSPRIGPRLWYTHYPSGYLIPFSILYDLGWDSLFGLRLFSIVLSLIALGLMYLTFERITSPRVAFVAILFYGLSPPFLGYSDSLANQPLDDLLRFGFMYAVLMASQDSDLRGEQRWLIAAWAMEFVLSLSSFDSVLFVYAWLIGWDLFVKKQFTLKRYVIFGLAPLSALGIQVLQNSWYLGFSDAITDLTDTFFVYHTTNTDQGKILAHIDLVYKLFSKCFNWGGVLIPAAWGALYFGRRNTVTNADDLPSTKLLSLLLVCGLLFPLVLPQAGAMSYESRQLIPFICLLVSGISWLVILGSRDVIQNHTEKRPATSRHFWRFIVLGFSTLLCLAIWINFAQSKRSSEVNDSGATPEILFAERLKERQTRYPPVYINYKGINFFQNAAYVRGYPQISPFIEYYLGSSTVLCMDEPDALAHDLENMIRKTEKPFSPVLITTDLPGVKKALSLLAEKGFTKSMEFPDNPTNEIFVIDLTDLVDWKSVWRSRFITPAPALKPLK